ncbi:hypothetical protein EDB80DRAFT_724513 [Ilyonectria destructans]|nr:hypothetical protein EDB80DRAFT_724513 [Ilyonectria destructans]
MPTTTLFLGHLLPAAAIELGRLVLSVQNPEQDFLQAEDVTLTAQDVLTQSFGSLHHTFEQENGSGFGVSLTALISGARNIQKKSRIDVSSALCITRQLQNSGQFLEALCKSRAAQRWLEKAIRSRREVYLVVGIKTITNAQIVEEVANESRVEGRVQTPVTLAITTAAGIPIPVDGILDSSIEAKGLRALSERTSFFAPGEQIFAVQYRKIRFARFSSRKVKDATLAKANSWEMYLGGRGGGEAETEIISAEVSDYVQASDLKGTVYNTATDNGDTFIYPTE